MEASRRVPGNSRLASIRGDEDLTIAGLRATVAKPRRFFWWHTTKNVGVYVSHESRREAHEKPPDILHLEKATELGACLAL
jgi:hypothetical protein